MVLYEVNSLIMMSKVIVFNDVYGFGVILNFFLVKKFVFFVCLNGLGLFCFFGLLIVEFEFIDFLFLVLFL